MGDYSATQNDTSLIGYFGRRLIQKRHPDVQTIPLPPVLVNAGGVNESINAPRPSAEDILPVGIIGAGVGGLYCALILKSLNIPFQIFESQNRVGGRLYTYKFEKGGEYDYYDVGAMRYPLPPKLPGESGDYKNGVMKRLGQLISRLNLENKLIPYYYESAPDSGPTYRYYNGVQSTADPTMRGRELLKDIEPQDAERYISVGVDAIMKDVLMEFLTALEEDITTGGNAGWLKLTAVDAHSLRSYLAFAYEPSPELNLPTERGLPTDVINWMETFNNSTGSFDRAFSEAVLDSMAFNEFGEEEKSPVVVEWKCFDGGSNVLTDRMENEVGKSTILKNATVTGIAPVDPNDVGSPMQVTWTAKDRSVHTRRYAHVISTVPLPSLRIMDISQCDLTPMQSTALRMLQYGPSIKIGVRFKSAWWKTGTNLSGETLNITGGSSSTDLPIRTVVYPSYGTASGQQPSNVLIASYGWTTDAERISALFKEGHEPPYDPRLKTVVLSNLATLHNVSFEFLECQFEEMYPWNWNHDPHAGGAFSYFGPGEFESLYHSLNLPAANGRLHFVSELLSIRHAWVVGALDSAWRAVEEYLWCSGNHDQISTFHELWGQNEEWVVPETGKTPKSGPANHSNNLLLRHLWSQRAEVFERMGI